MSKFVWLNLISFKSSNLWYLDSMYYRFFYLHISKLILDEPRHIHIKEQQKVSTSRYSCIHVSDIKVSRYPLSRYPDIKVSRYPGIQVSRFLGIQASRYSLSRYPDIQVFRYPGIQVSRYPGIKVSRYPDIHYPGLLLFSLNTRELKSWHDVGDIIQCLGE